MLLISPCSSLPNPLNRCGKSIMKMQLDQRGRAMLQLHLSDQQFDCLLMCVLCYRFDDKCCCNQCSGIIIMYHVMSFNMAEEITKPSSVFPSVKIERVCLITHQSEISGYATSLAHIYKYSLLMHCIKIKSRAKSLLNEQYVFVGGNISFLCVLSCSSEEA